MKNRSVKFKLTLWYTIIMLIVTTVVLSAMTSVSSKMLATDTKQKLNRSVGILSDELERIPNIKHVPGFKYFEQGVQMTLYDVNGNIAGGQVPFGISEKLNVAEGSVRTEVYNGNTYYVTDKKITSSNGQTYWLKGFVSASDQTYAIKNLAKSNALLALIMILIAALGGYIIIRRALTPIEKIRSTADEIRKSDDLSRRIALNEGSDEFHRLAQSFDDMLDRIEATVSREKQFTSDASHELRTPIAAILSACEYMTTYATDADELKHSAESVKQQAERMSRLVSELLTISRMDNNTLQTSFEVVDISELLELVCDEQEELHPESGTRLVRNIEASVCARADRMLLIRLCINLISNAYSYSRENGTVWVSLSRKGENLVLSVKDNGIGISPENLPRIWERFYQADPSRSKNSDGSMGLGLSMVKWIAELHKGLVSAESTLGLGSLFTFVMPAE